MSDIYEQLADLLEYPNTNFDSRITTGAGGDLLTPFRSAVAELTLSDHQELYTRTFDLNPACALEVGYHLFGENYKRGEFLANLRETEAPFELGQAQQLPDYLPVLLRLLPKLEDQDLRSSLITECLVPAIEKMLKTFKDAANPYRSLLEAVRTRLQAEPCTLRTELLPAQARMRATLPVINASPMELKPELF